MLGRFVTHLDARSDPALRAAKIIEGGLRQARRWHHEIHLPFIAKDAARLDHRWNWIRLIAWTSLLERTALRRAVFLQLNTRLANGDALPVGQILVSDGYRYFPRPPGPCVFLWYLSTAPPAALVHHGLPADLRLMKPLVDAALQFSELRGYRGRIALHAASSGEPKADQKLSDTYAKGIGLAPFPASGRVSAVRTNDGRYFHADEQRALDLAAPLDYLR
jgi:hypothetical protein